MDVNLRESKRIEPIGSRLPNYLTPLQRAFFIDMLRGRHTIPSSQQIVDEVNGQFTHQTLTTLDVNQSAQLKTDMRNAYLHVFASPRWRLMGKNVVYLPSSTSSNGVVEHAFLSEDYMNRTGQNVTRQFLSAQEKERLLTDPNVYSQAELVEHAFSQRLLGNGTRHLCDEQATPIDCGNGKLIYDTYGYTVPYFTGMLDRIRKSQGKGPNEPLFGLDIGGSNGLGAYDAEKLDLHLIMSNMTIHPELAIWPIRGRYYFLQAENMPDSFSERFDIIFSNMSFRYMRYRDIALENVLRSLRVGGIASIHLSSDYVPFGEGYNPDLTARVIDRQLQRMEQLHHSGVITYLPVDERFPDAKKIWEKEPRGLDGMIYLQKTASMR